MSRAAYAARGMTYLATQGFVSLLFSFLYFGFAARLLDKSEIGQLAWIAVFITFYPSLFSLGLPQGINRQVALRESQGGVEEAAGIGRQALKLGIVLSISASATALLVLNFLSEPLFGFPLPVVYMTLIGLDILLLVFNSFNIAVLMGVRDYGHVSLYATFSFGVRSLSAILLLPWGILGVLAGWVLGSLASLILFLSRIIRTGYGAKGREVPFSELWSYSAPLYLSSIVNYFKLNADKMLLLYFTNYSSLGVYNVAVAITSSLSVVLGAISSVMFPELSHVFASSVRDIRQVVRTASRYFFLAYLPMAVGLAVVAYPAITLIAGRAYAEGAAPLAILSLALAVAGLASILNPVLLSTGATKVVPVIAVISITTAASISLVAIPQLGTEGGAITRGVLLVSQLVAVTVTTRIYGQLSLDTSALKASVVGSLLMAFIVLLAEYALGFNKYFLPGYIALGAVTYILYIRSVRVLTQNDKDLLRSYVPAPLRPVLNRLLGRSE